MFVLDYAIKQCDTVCKKYGMKAIEKPKHQQTTYNTTKAKREEKKKQNKFLANILLVRDTIIKRNGTQPYGLHTIYRTFETGALISLHRNVCARLLT